MTISLSMWAAPVILSGLVVLIGVAMAWITLRRPEVGAQVDRLADPAPIAGERRSL